MANLFSKEDRAVESGSGPPLLRPPPGTSRDIQNAPIRRASHPEDLIPSSTLPKGGMPSFVQIVPQPKDFHDPQAMSMLPSGDWMLSDVSLPIVYRASRRSPGGSRPSVAQPKPPPPRSGTPGYAYASQASQAGRRPPGDTVRECDRATKETWKYGGQMNQPILASKEAATIAPDVSIEEILGIDQEGAPFPVISDPRSTESRCPAATRRMRYVGR